MFGYITFVIKAIDTVNKLNGGLFDFYFEARLFYCVERCLVT